MTRRAQSQDVILEHVVAVLRQVTMSEAAVITEATELFYDLGLAGEDLAEAVDGIRAPYGTDFGQMNLRRYSPGEVHDPGFNIVRDFREWRGERTYRSLTVASLIDAIQAGSWSDS